MLELQGMQSMPLLPLLPGPLWPGRVAADRILFMGQIELNFVLMLNNGFPLVKAYTHALFVSCKQFVDFIYGWMYRSTTSAGFIIGQGGIFL